MHYSGMLAARKATSKQGTRRWHSLPGKLEAAQVPQIRIIARKQRIISNRIASTPANTLAE